MRFRRYDLCFERDAFMATDARNRRFELLAMLHHLDAASSLSSGKQNETKSAGPRPCFLNRSPQLGVTVHAIRHLLARAVLLRPQTRTLLFQWADWRPRHNHEARQWHYHHHSHMQL